MQDENKGGYAPDDSNAGSNTSGATEQAKTEQSVAADQAGAESAAEPKTGDPCTCPDGRAGTLQPLGDSNGALICLVNEGF